MTALIFGMNGMCAGFVVALLVTLITVMVFVFLRFEKYNFPLLHKDMDYDIVVMDDKLIPENVSRLTEEAARDIGMKTDTSAFGGSGGTSFVNIDSGWSVYL